MNKTLYLLTFCFFILACNRRIVLESIHSDERNQQSIIDVCDLANHKHQEVITKGIYSGIDEYWDFSSFDKRCVPPTKIDLNVDTLHLTSEQEKMFRKVLEVYWKRSLVITAKGIYSDDQKAYGHLGSNQAEFVTTRILAMELVENTKGNYRKKNIFSRLFH
ncbi:hypothetical protein [Spirosoma aerolatum]|uniref:hypothetical protein n=1 Tax=Spirosoma aerolatum TaxID=1211326 RepID=UPI0009AC92C4|nr:hypothetical protein [Spirosoma aerolatum]